jgi:hypothetical protein
VAAVLGAIACGVSPGMLGLHRGLRFAGNAVPGARGSEGAAAEVFSALYLAFGLGGESVGRSLRGPGAGAPGLAGVGARSGVQQSGVRPGPVTGVA